MISIPESELTWRFSRSSGPGGQGVNTTDSRAELSWDLSRTTALRDEQRRRALDRLSGRLVDGVITIAASEYRSQLRNRDAARARLQALVEQAVVPSKHRRATKPTRGSQLRRIEAKKRRSDIKRSRRAPD